MSAFDWGDCYLTGEDEIDVQHRRLVELINTFADLVTGERTGGGIGVADALTALADYANVHFADEERLAEAAGVDARTREAHTRQHGAFVAEVGRMVAGAVQPADLLEFLVSWLGHHILETDRSLTREINAVRAGVPPAQAREDELDRVAENRDPLLRALNGLFAALSRRNAELAEANATLEARVLERTAALAAANRRLEVAASTDFLTGLPNRRQALARLEELSADPAPLGVVMLDADGFKAVNDTWGHEAGDDVLRAFARAVAGAVRSDDTVARLGGDEFVVLCPATDLAGALRVGEQVRQAVAHLCVPVGAGTWQGSTSVGVASAAGVEADRAPALMRAADEALYAAKRGGRNCVATSTGVVAPRRRRGPGSHAGYCHSH